MIERAYLEMINPENIRSFFKTKEEFISWLEIGNKQDLICTLQAFEDAEMYEDCAIIKNKIDGYN